MQGESLASTASSTGTHDPGDGAPRRMMAPCSANHRRAAGQMIEPGLESGWRGLTKGDAGMKPHRWSERVHVAAEECQCHPGTPTLAGQPQRQGQKQPGWCEGRFQVDDRAGPRSRAESLSWRLGNPQGHATRHWLRPPFIPRIAHAHYIGQLPE